MYQQLRNSGLVFFFLKLDDPQTKAVLAKAEMKSFTNDLCQKRA